MLFGDPIVKSVVKLYAIWGCYCEVCGKVVCYLGMLLWSLW